MKLGLLETLIEAGAPLDIADKNGETPLITALILNDIDSANLLIQVSLEMFDNGLEPWELENFEIYQKSAF